MISRRTVLLAASGAAVSPHEHWELRTVKHVVLLGDSVFDNAAYVGKDPPLQTQLEHLLPKGHRVTLLAKDGAVIADLGWQLNRLPGDVTHLVLSVGGNDAIRASRVLDARVNSVAAALEMLGTVAEGFGREYATMLGRVAQTALPAAICTIFFPRFPELARRRIAAANLAVLNEQIS